VGNKTSASNANGEIAHNANNELTQYGDLKYVYDDNGNLTEVWQFGGVAKRFTYNADNRLVKAVTAHGGVQAEYYYDPFGRRLWKEVNGRKTYFFYSDEGLVAEYDDSGAELRSYGYKPDSTWTTDPLWLKLALSGVEGACPERSRRGRGVFLLPQRPSRHAPTAHHHQRPGRLAGLLQRLWRSLHPARPHHQQPALSGAVL
jgi:YD repeat-containing protein